MEDPVFFIYGDVKDEEKVQRALAELVRLEKRTAALLRAAERFDRQHRFLYLSLQVSDSLERARHIFQLAQKDIHAACALQKH